MLRQSAMLLPMKCSIHLATRLLVGPGVRIHLLEKDGRCGIFLDGESVTPYVGESWEEALWKLRNETFAAASLSEKTGELYSPGTVPDAPQHDEEATSNKIASS